LHRIESPPLRVAVVVLRLPPLAPFRTDTSTIGRLVIFSFFPLLLQARETMDRGYGLGRSGTEARRPVSTGSHMPYVHLERSWLLNAVPVRAEIVETAKRGEPCRFSSSFL
jgi:hypothetical protein